MSVPIRVLLVDDSAFMRTALRVMMGTDPAIQIVGEACDGREAIEAVRTLRPHVVTMDVEMPVMNGIQAAEAIATEHGQRVAVIMVSSVTQEGAALTLQALTRGAVDFVSKSTLSLNFDISHINNELLPKIHYWAGNRSGARPRPAAPAPKAAVAPAQAPRPDRPVDLVVVGASTGGPATLPAFLRALGTPPCPVLVAQHMPELFTAPFAENLRRELSLDVIEGEFNAPIRRNSVVILAGGTDAMVRMMNRETGEFYLRRTDSGATIHPSVDTLFRSAAEIAANPVAVILTGMGADGTEGARQLAGRGAPILVQLPGTAVVPGMPEAAIEAGLASDVLAPEDIARRIVRWFNRSPKSEVPQ